MPTVSVSRTVTPDAAASVLQAQLGNAKVEVKSSDPGLLQVSTGPFARAKVHMHEDGGGTTFDVRPSPIGPIGWLVDVAWYTKRVAKAIEQAPELRAEG